MAVASEGADGRGRPGPPPTPLYHGAAGVIWALHYLQALRASPSERRFDAEVAPLLARHRAWLAAALPGDETAAYLIGETPILMMAQAHAPTEERAEQIERLIDGNIESPTRELMWGCAGHDARGVVHARTHWRVRAGRSCFAAQRERCGRNCSGRTEHECSLLDAGPLRHQHTFIDAVHGFVGTASPLIRGRHLLDDASGPSGNACIANTVRRCATSKQGLANWRARLTQPEGRTARMLMQFCHGSPGFIVCLGRLSERRARRPAAGGGEATWLPGPLDERLERLPRHRRQRLRVPEVVRAYRRRDWLERARAFAMHAIGQTQADAAATVTCATRCGPATSGSRSILWDCIHARARFPTLDVFFAD